MPKYSTQSVAKPALEKFMLSLPKYAGFACTSARLSMKVEADEAQKCLSQTEFEGRSPRSNVRRVFFGAAGARKQHLHASVTDTAYFGRLSINFSSAEAFFAYFFSLKKVRSRPLASIFNFLIFRSDHYFFTKEKVCDREKIA